MLTLLVTAALAAEVVLEGSTWRRLQDPTARPGLEAPALSRREVAVGRADGGWRVTTSLLLDLPGAREIPVAPGDAVVETLTLDGRAVGAGRGARTQGPLAVLVPAGRHQLVVVTLVRGAGDALDLRLPEAALGRVCLPVGLELPAPAPPKVDGCYVTGVGGLTVGAKASPLLLPDALVVARSDVGLTVQDDGLEVDAVLTWEARRGRIREVAFRAPGEAGLLDVRAPGAEVVRAGERVTVRLPSPTERVALVVSGAVPFGAGERGRAALPTLLPLDVQRVERSVLLHRTTAYPVDVDVRGGSARLPGEVVAAGRVRVEGEPVAAWVGDVAGEVAVLRATPEAQPPVVVDLAAFAATLSEEGRALVQASLTVRNERAAALGLRLPAGHRLVAAEVDGRPVALARDGEDWRVPLPRSVETVRGPLGFPVELTILDAEGVVWRDGRDERRLELPVIDAPIAVRRVTVNLPRGWDPVGEAGERGRVEHFTEGAGLSYGFGVVDEARAQALYRDAVQSWLENDFDAAKGKLDALGALGADNENVLRLRANLDVIDGKDTGADERMVRQVKEQAQARAADDYRAQEEALAEAIRAEQAGDEATRVRALEKAEALNQRLSGLEQEESERQARVREVVVRGLGAKGAGRGGGSAVGYGAAGVSRSSVSRSEVVVSKVEAAPLLLDFAEISDTETSVAASADASVLHSGTVLPNPEAGKALWEEGALAPYAMPEPGLRSGVVGAALVSDGASLRDNVSTVIAEALFEASGGVVGGVEGGVVGGVLGGVSHGAVGAGLSAPVAPPPPSAAPPPASARRSAYMLRARPPEAAAEGPREIKYKQRTEIDFEGVDVSGELIKPAGALLLMSGTTVGPAGSAFHAAAADGPAPMAAPAPSTLPAPPPLDVTATSTAAVLPVVGATLRFQHLLVQPEDDVPVVLVARSTSPRRSR